MSAERPTSFRLSAANRAVLQAEAARRDLSAGALIRQALVEAGVPLQLEHPRNTARA